MRSVCKKKLITLLLPLFLFTRALVAQELPPISYLGIEQGLSNNSVRSIFQDHQGYMWFGTYDGLSRYDGYEFKVFRNKLNDTNSLPHNYIYAIHEDPHHHIWVGTGQGIGIYDPLDMKFHPVDYLNGKQKEKITFNVSVFQTDAQGNTFIGSNGWGLLIRYQNTAAAVQVPMLRDGKKSTGYSVTALKMDRKQRMWLLVDDVGLCVYDPVGKVVRIVSRFADAGQCMDADREGNFWIGTNNGLFLYRMSSNELEPAPLGKSQVLNSENVASLLIDQQHNLWIGTEGGGINIFNIKEGRLHSIQASLERKGLSSESVFALYQDKDARMWLGTLKGGINMIDPVKKRFQTIAHDPMDRNSLVYNFVSSFYEDSDQNLWVGTDGGGFSIWDRKQNRFINFEHQAGNSRSLSNNLISSITEDHLHQIWIATYGGGINKFDKATQSFQHYKCMDDVSGKENKLVWLLYEDGHQDLWATTFMSGKLYRFNREANRFEVFDRELRDLIAIKEDRSGNLWVGNSHQLIRIDRKKRQHQYYEIGKPIRAIHEDSKGNFWVGSEGGGLILFDRKEGKIRTRYSDANGLCNNAVLNIEEDGKGQLWLSTFNGLSQFDPSSSHFQNYYQDDGLQSNQFLYNAALRLRSGALVFGGIKGFNLFHPDRIQNFAKSPPVRITGLHINGMPLSSEHSYIAASRADRIEALEIPFNEAALSIDFAALEYSAPGKISYAYYLQGWDKGWNYSGKLRTANYTHLREGTYTLRIKATNAAGLWNAEEAYVHITVLPPWYRSWWAYSFYLLLIGAAIYLFQQYRTRQAKLEYEVRLAKVSAEKERAERETEKVINEREKEINEKRLSFFTNISHEFRTPLTLIINPIKDLLNKARQEENADHQELAIVYRNTRRLLSLVDQLLLFRKTDTGGDQLKITRLHLISLCTEVFQAFQQQAKSQQIDYRLICEQEELELYADREQVEIIFYNLISNALKYTPQGGTVTFTIRDCHDHIELQVADSGQGIPQEVGNQLFDKFYQVHGQSVSSKTGFGIGLYLVKHFVEAHQGQITYTSELGNGSIFFVRFLKGKAHFGNLPIQEKAPEETVFLKELAADAPIVEKSPGSKDKKVELDALVNEQSTLLLVDDDEQIRQYIAGVFDQFTVYQAGTGEEALVLAHEYAPEIIISDVKMPGISGIDFCKTVKDDPALSHIPVILLTAESSLDIKLQGVEGGADDYITKPFEKDLLVARVTNLLKSRNNLQKYFYNEVTLQQNPLKISSEYKEFLDKCISVVEQHLDDENFNVKVLAQELNVSHSYLYKKVKSISGQTITSFIRFIRIRKAAELFINSNLNVNEVAFEVGISSIKYFREHFAKQFGMTPSEYIKKYRTTFAKSFNLNEGALK